MQAALAVLGAQLLHLLGRNTQQLAQNAHHLATHAIACILVGKAAHLSARQRIDRHALLAAQPQVGPREHVRPGTLDKRTGRDDRRRRQLAASRLSLAHEHQQQRTRLGLASGHRDIVKGTVAVHVRLERAIDLARLKPAEQLRRAVEHVDRTVKRRERLRQHALHAILHRVERHELLRHHGRRTVAHARHKLERRQVYVAKGRVIALVATAKRRRRQRVLSFGQRAQRHRTQLERRVLQHETQRARAQALGVARRHIAVEHTRGIRRIALNRANMKALGNRADGGTASSLGLLLRRRKDAVASQHQADHVARAQCIDSQRRKQRRRQVALERHHGARRTAGAGVIAHGEHQRLPQPFLGAKLGQLVVLQGIEHHTALDLLNQQALLKTRRLGHHAAAVVEHKRAAGIHRLVVCTDRRHAGKPHAALRCDLAVGSAAHGGDRGGLAVGHIECVELEIGNEVDAGRQHLELAGQVEDHRGAHAVHVEHRRRPTRVVVLATLQGNARTRGHHATVLEHHIVEQGLALKRNRCGHDADHIELLNTLGDAGQAGKHVVLKVGSAHQAAGQGSHKERSRHAQHTRTALVSQARLVLDATADTLNITQAHIDLCKCELHGSALSVVNRRYRSKSAGRKMQSALACAYASYDTPSGGALLERRGPQPVQVAIGIDGTGLGTAGKKCRGLHAGLEVMDLQTALGLKGNPLDVVLGHHRMLDRAHARTDHVTVALALDDGHVLLVRRVLGVRGQLRAAGRGCNVVAKGGDELAVGVLKEFRHDVLLC